MNLDMRRITSSRSASRAIISRIWLTTLLMVGLSDVNDAATIRGYVVDARSGEPLPTASVILVGTDRGAATNLDGFFVVDFLKPGIYRLHISYLGYQNQDLDVSIAEGQSDPIKIQIIPFRLALAGVLVSAKKDDLEAERTSPRVSTVPIEARILRTMPSIGGEMDILRSIQTIPGVKASSDISAALYVRGGSPDQTLILMDHNTVYNPSHLFGVFSTFNADAVKQINLIKGGFPASYGGRSGSVLEVITNEGNRKQMEGLFSIGAISARVALEGPLPNARGSYAVSGRRTYLDPILDAMRKSQNIDLPDYYFYDANSKVNLDVTDRTTITVAGYWGDDKMDINFGADDARMHMYMTWGNRTLSTRVRHAIGRNMFGSFGAAVSRYQSEWKMEDDEKASLDYGRDRLYDWSWKSNLEWHLASHQLETGFWVSQYDVKFREDVLSKTYVDVSGVANNWSFYLQDCWRVNAFIDMLPGLRGYYHTAGSHKALDPRLSVVYHYDPQLRFKVAGGRYSQFINLMSFGEGFSNFDLWIPIDKSMAPAYSWQGIVGCEWDPVEDLEFTTEAYYTDMHNIEAFDPMTDRGVEAADAFVVGKGNAYGVELMLQKREGRWSGWAGYALSWTRQRFTESLINDGNWFFPKWDRRHDFIVVGAYRVNRRWELSGSWRYNTGQGFTQGKGLETVYHAGIDPDYLGNYGMEVVSGSKNNYRFPADHRLDVTATYHHLFMKKPAQLIISVFNLYSRRSYWMRTFPQQVEGERVWTEVSDVKLLPILPMVSYEVRF